MTFHIGHARYAHIARLRAVEIDAGERFRLVGLERVADDDPPSAELLGWHIADGTAWVAKLDGLVVGYATSSVVDGEGHLDQVSVIGAASGQGVGRALIEQVESWAQSHGLESVTLTTFRDVAWNGPYYVRLGYVAIVDDELGPELVAIRRAEFDAGLDVVPRIAMRKVL